MEASILNPPPYRRRTFVGSGVAVAEATARINRSGWSIENQEGELVKHCWLNDQFLDSSRHRQPAVEKKR